MMAHFIFQLDWAMECLGMVKYPRCCCSGVFRSDENCIIFLLLCVLEQGLTDGFNWLVKGDPELLTLLLYLRVLGLHTSVPPPPHLAYAVLGVELRAFCVLSNQASN